MVAAAAEAERFLTLSTTMLASGLLQLMSYSHHTGLHRKGKPLLNRNRNRRRLDHNQWQQNLPTGY